MRLSQLQMRLTSKPNHLSDGLLPKTKVTKIIKEVSTFIPKITKFHFISNILQNHFYDILMPIRISWLADVFASFSHSSHASV